MKTMCASREATNISPSAHLSTELDWRKHAQNHQANKQRKVPNRRLTKRKKKGEGLCIFQ